MIRIPFTYKNGHEKLRLLLSPYLDGRLASGEASLLEAHLSTCTPCNWELETLRSTVSLLKGLRMPAPSRSFVLRDQPTPVSTKSPAYVWAVRYAASAAALLLVVLLAGNLSGLVSQSGAQLSAPAPEPTQAALRGAATEKSLQAPSPAVAPIPAMDTAPLAPSALPNSGASATPAPPTFNSASETDLGNAVYDTARPAAALQQTSDGKLSLPLWQLEIAIGGAALILGAFAIWLTLRRKSSL